MTDDTELIARLRDLGFNLTDSAADRIEALTAKVKLMEDLDAINGEKIEALEAKLATCEKYRDAYAECDRIGTQAVRDLEAKLAKAVETLEFYATQDVIYPHVGKVTFTGYDDDGSLARATLAEIKGESHE